MDSKVINLKCLLGPKLSVIFDSLHYCTVLSRYCIGVIELLRGVSESVWEIFWEDLVSLLYIEDFSEINVGLKCFVGIIFFHSALLINRVWIVHLYERLTLDALFTQLLLVSYPLPLIKIFPYVKLSILSIKFCTRANSSNESKPKALTNTTLHIRSIGHEGLD